MDEVFEFTHRGRLSRVKLPPKSARAARCSKRKVRTIVPAGGHVLPDRSVSYPDIYVGVGKTAYGGMVYAKCQIKLKRKLYRYLVWKHEGKQFSFYLGRVKILAPLPRLQLPRPAGALERAGELRRGVRK